MIIVTKTTNLFTKAGRDAEKNNINTGTE